MCTHQSRPPATRPLYNTSMDFLTPGKRQKRPNIVSPGSGVLSSILRIKSTGGCWCYYQVHRQNRSVPSIPPLSLGLDPPPFLTKHILAIRVSSCAVEVTCNQLRATNYNAIRPCVCDLLCLVPSKTILLRVSFRLKFPKKSIHSISPTHNRQIQKRSRKDQHSRRLSGWSELLRKSLRT